MLPGLIDFQNFAQGFGFAGNEAISEARQCWKICHEGFRRTMAVVLITEQNQTGHDCHDCQWNEHQTLDNFLQLFRKT